jgi:transposase-like protein
MPPVDRNGPVSSNASESSYSLVEFMRDFPNDAACLDWLWRNRYASDGHRADCPKCERPRKFHKVKGRPAWDCDSCGHHLHPLAGTIFAKSSTSLHLWFFALHLMTSTRCGVSAKQLERELGVTYKTAWRMLNKIRNVLMTEDGPSPDSTREYAAGAARTDTIEGFLAPSTTGSSGNAREVSHSGCRRPERIQRAPRPSLRLPSDVRAPS